MKELNKRERDFCYYYTSECKANATQSYLKAYSVTDINKAKVNACRLLKRDYIQAFIKEINDKHEQQHIMNVEQMKQKLTSIILEEESEETIVIEGTGQGYSQARITRKRPSNKDKIKALEILAKMQGAFSDNINNTIIPIVINDESQLKD